MDFRNWQTQLRKGLLEMVLMNLLGEGESHGYEMVRRLKQFKGLEIREGNVYPVLARLQMDGLVSTYTLASTDGPQRKYYKLTRAGEQVLARMNGHWDELAEGVEQTRSGGSKQWKIRTKSGKS